MDPWLGWAVCKCVVTSHAVLGSSLTRAVSGEGQIYKLLSAASDNSRGGSTGQVEGVGWGRWCLVEGASRASMSWVPGLLPLCHRRSPASALTDPVVYTCAVHVVSRWPSQLRSGWEFSWPPGVASCSPFGSQSWDLLSLPSSLSLRSLSEPSAAPGPEPLTALPTLLGEQGEWGHPRPCVGLRRELEATPGLQLRTGGFLALAFWKIDSLQLPSGGSAPQEALGSCAFSDLTEQLSSLLARAFLVFGLVGSL